MKLRLCIVLLYKFIEKCTMYSSTAASKIAMVRLSRPGRPVPSERCSSRAVGHGMRKRQSLERARAPNWLQQSIISVHYRRPRGQATRAAHWNIRYAAPTLVFLFVSFCSSHPFVADVPARLSLYVCTAKPCPDACLSVCASRAKHV